MPWYEGPTSLRALDESIKIEEKDSSIVFGKIEWIENGEKKVFKEEGLFGTWVKPNLMNMDTAPDNRSC